MSSPTIARAACAQRLQQLRRAHRWRCCVAMLRWRSSMRIEEHQAEQRAEHVQHPPERIAPAEPVERPARSRGGRCSAAVRRSWTARRAAGTSPARPGRCGRRCPAPGRWTGDSTADTRAATSGNNKSSGGQSHHRDATCRRAHCASGRQARRRGWMPSCCWPTRSAEPRVAGQRMPRSRVDDSQRTTALIERRAAGEPLAYILGLQGFLDPAPARHAGRAGAAAGNRAAGRAGAAPLPAPPPAWWTWAPDPAPSRSRSRASGRTGESRRTDASIEALAVARANAVAPGAGARRVAARQLVRAAGRATLRPHRQQSALHRRGRPGARVARRSAHEPQHGPVAGSGWHGVPARNHPRRAAIIWSAAAGCCSSTAPHRAAKLRVSLSRAASVTYAPIAISPGTSA